MTDATLRKILKAELGEFKREVRQEFRGEFKAFKLDVDLGLASYFGKMTRHFDERFSALQQELRDTKDMVYNQLDGVIARLEENDHQHAAMQNQLDRHERLLKP